MRLSKGQTLSHYEILGTLGAGGMGVVYRARDTKLDREVALKVLPEGLVDDEGSLARFEREAKLLAALNHPNVATIFGVDHVDGVSFITLELVPGETLRDKIARGPLMISEAVRIAREVAAGLQAAHEAGIVHRDLKPANIIVRPDGPVKILDFGLARQTEVGDDKAAVQLTQQFQILGTPGYLSPEQARGEVADQRADIWAFGCVLFECLAGEKAFKGETVGESIQAVFDHTPDLDTLPPKTPHALRVLVSRCLSKESNERLRDIGDVRILLEGAVDRSISMVSGPIVITQQPKSHKFLVGSVIALGLVALALAVLLLLTRGSDETPPAATPVVAGTNTLALPGSSELGWRQSSASLSKLGRGSPLLAISPDGKRVAYCAIEGDRSAIYVHVPGETEPTDPLPGTKMARAPFFSPDGQQVGFLASDNWIKWVSADGGGAARKIHELDTPSPNFSACWTGDSVIFGDEDRGLTIVPLGGGDGVPLTKRDKQEEFEHLGPTVLPGADLLLFTVSLGNKSRIAMLDLKTKKWRPVLEDAGNARYCDGWLVYAQDGALQRMVFDPRQPDQHGLPQPLLDNVFTTPCAGGGSSITHFDLARDGTLAYAPAPAHKTRSTAYWVTRGTEGRGKAFVSPVDGDWKHPRLSPSGNRFAIDALDFKGVKDVVVYDLRSNTPEGKKTFNGMSLMSAYAPDGSLTVRSTHRSTLRAVRSDDEEELFPEFDGILYADSWTPDGRTLVITRKKGDQSSLYTYTRGDDAPKELFPSNAKARFGQVHPGGQWLAYVKTAAGHPAVEVRPFPSGSQQPVLVTQGVGGGAPMWSKNGKELFYRKPDGTMMAAEFETDPKFKVTKRTALFQNDYDADPGGHQHYDVTADGQRFLMIKNEYFAPDHLHVVANPLSR